LRVIVTRRPKYACRSCTDGVVQAPAPARLIPGGMPTEATMVNVLVSKYADSWTKRRPGAGPGARKTKTGYLWALARDDRPWGGEDPPGVVYFYAPGRAGENAETFLTGFDGILQIDVTPATTA
jgi:transposase